MIPTNLKEAIEILDEQLFKEDKEYLLEHGALAVHHSLGRWIRNNFGLWEEDSQFKQEFSKLGYMHPDDISNYIIEEYIKHLTTKNDLESKYVDNDVFKFSITLNGDLIGEDINIYTKPFPEFPLEKYKDQDQVDNFYDAQEDLVQEKYFTQERIDELKAKFIKRIQESKNPFDIYCVDRDGGYNVTKDQLFNLD